MTISIIAAVAKNNVIGKNNDLVWHLPKDLKFFKDKTSGHHIIMGRKNYETLMRPLPNRTSVIITRRKNYQAPGCIVVHSIEEAIAKVENDAEPFIIGGGQIYRQSMHIANRMYITHIDESFEGDTYFPEIDLHTWKVVSRTNHPADEKNPYAFSIVVYERKK